MFIQKQRQSHNERNHVVKNDRLIQAFKEMTPRYEAAVNNELQRFWGWSYLNFVDKLIDITPIHEHDTVLDVATGTAVIPMRLLEQNRIADFIVGLDITLDMLRNASKHIQEEGNSGAHRVGLRRCNGHAFQEKCI